jgi:hypothetical protein
MAKKTEKKSKSAIPQWANPVVQYVNKKAEPYLKKFQNSKLGKVVTKVIPSVVSPASIAKNTGNKKLPVTPKVTQPAKNTSAKNTSAKKAPVKKENKIKSGLVGWVAGGIRATDSPKPAEKKLTLKEKGNRILDGWKEETQKYNDNIIRGQTQCGAYRYYLGTSILLGETSYYLFQLKNVVASELNLPNIQDNYNKAKSNLNVNFDKAGNDVYNAKIPFVSNFVGALTNSSDYKKNGPLQLESKGFNRTLAIMNYSLRAAITGGTICPADSATIKNNPIEDTNMSSVLGSYLGGFLVDGGAKMADGVVELGINPLGVLEGVADIVRNQREVLPAVWKKSGDYINHIATEAGPQEKARLDGKIMFEILSILWLAKAGKGAEGTKAIQESTIVEEGGQQFLNRNGVTINNAEVEVAEGARAETAASGAVEGSGQYGKQISISEQKMYQQGQHFNKHGVDMGYASKKAYEQGARDFIESNKHNAEIFEGTWNSSRGIQGGEEQIIMRYEGKQAIINKESGQIVDFYEGTSLDGFIDIRQVQ